MQPIFAEPRLTFIQERTRVQFEFDFECEASGPSAESSFSLLDVPIQEIIPGRAALLVPYLG